MFSSFHKFHSNASSIFIYHKKYTRIKKSRFFKKMPFGYSKAESLSCTFQIPCVSFQEIKSVVSKAWRQAVFGVFSFKQDLPFQWVASETGNFNPCQTKSYGHRSVQSFKGLTLLWFSCSAVGGNSYLDYHPHFTNGYWLPIKHFQPLCFWEAWPKKFTQGLPVCLQQNILNL